MGGMTKPPALFSYHNVQKKSCLVEESAESETEEEEERDLYEEEKCELFESEDEGSEVDWKWGEEEDVTQLQCEELASGGEEEILSGRPMLPVPFPALCGIPGHSLYTAGRQTQLYSQRGGDGG